MINKKLSTQISDFMPEFKLKILYFNAGIYGKNDSIDKSIGIGFATNYQLNIGVNVHVKELEFGEDELVSLTFWDISNKENFKFFRQSLYRGISGAVLIFDISDLQMYEEIKKLLADIQEVVGKKVPFILIGINSSISDSGSPLDRKEIDSFIEIEGGVYMETTDKIEEQFNEAIYDLTRQIIEERMLLH